MYWEDETRELCAIGEAYGHLKVDIDFGGHLLLAMINSGAQVNLINSRIIEIKKLAIVRRRKLY